MEANDNDGDNNVDDSDIPTKEPHKLGQMSNAKSQNLTFIFKMSKVKSQSSSAKGQSSQVKGQKSKVKCQRLRVKFIRTGIVYLLVTLSNHKRQVTFRFCLVVLKSQISSVKGQKSRVKGLVFQI